MPLGLKEKGKYQNEKKKILKNILHVHNFISINILQTFAIPLLYMIVISIF
jgi:hypothetical protein